MLGKRSKILQSLKKLKEKAPASFTSRGAFLIVRQLLPSSG
jgi:hypothetical protein